MQLPTQHLLKLLEARSVGTLVHANTAVTTTHFIRNRALLSRQKVLELGLCQTAQASDDVDPLVGVWNDVFVDSVDIHGRGGLRNKYGPVLLEFDVKILTEACNGLLWVTKSNPWYWRGKPDHLRWFQSEEEIDSDFGHDEFQHMFVFRDCAGELAFNDCLTRIVVDSPNITIDDTAVANAAINLLETALQDAGIDVPIERRQCRGGCKCELAYQQESEDEIKSMFMTCP